jgi:hypothetical protein
MFIDRRATNFTEFSTLESFKPPTVLTLDNYVEVFEKLEKIVNDALDALVLLSYFIIVDIGTNKKYDAFMASFERTENIRHLTARFGRHPNLTNCFEINEDLHAKYLAIKWISLIEKNLTFEHAFGVYNESAQADEDFDKLKKKFKKYLNVYTTMFEIFKYLINMYTDIFELKNCFETLSCGKT